VCFKHRPSYKLRLKKKKMLVEFISEAGIVCPLLLDLEMEKPERSGRKFCLLGRTLIL
jgi:hypothetical protein